MKQSKACVLCTKGPRRKGGMYCKDCHNASMRALRQRKKKQLKKDLRYLIKAADYYVDHLLKIGSGRGATEARLHIKEIAERHNVPRGTS